MEFTATIFFPECCEVIQDYRGICGASIAGEVTEVSAKMLPSCPADALPANLLAQAVKTA